MDDVETELSYLRKRIREIHQTRRAAQRDVSVVVDDEISSRWDATAVAVRDSTKISANSFTYLPPVPTIELIVSDVSFDVRNSFFKRRSKPTVRLLNRIDAHFRSGELCALMSPSGAGKTTFLNLLAQRIRNDAIVTGQITANGLLLSENFRYLTSYLPQDDVMYGLLSVQEQVTFQAKLRFPRDTSTAEIDTKVSALLDRLSITSCRNTLIGGPGYAQSVSGGERKRTSVATELVTNPCVLFLDEAVSGLDGSTAFAVIESLRRLAHEENRLVICSIHQPSQEVFELFDKLLLFAKLDDGTGGNLAFFGTRNEAELFFDWAGHPCPPNKNPASHYIQVLTPVVETQQDHSVIIRNIEEIRAVVRSFDEWGRQQLKSHLNERSRVSLIEMGAKFRKPFFDASNADGERGRKCCGSASQFIRSKTKNGDNYFHTDLPKRISVLKQFFILIHVHVLLLLRNPRTSFIRLIQALVLSVICGLIYVQLDFYQAGLQNRTGALFFLLNQVFMGSLMSVLHVLPTHRPVFLREHAARAYGGFAYWNAKSLIEVPFDVVLSFCYGIIAYYMIGLQPQKFGLFYLTMILVANAASSLGFFISAGVSDLQQAILIAPLVMIPLLIFGGFFIKQSSIPVYLIWLRYLSPFYYAFPVVMYNELAGTTYNCTTGELVANGIINGTVSYICPFQSGDAYLSYLGFGNVNIWFDLGMLGVITFGFRLCSLIIFMLVENKLQ